MDTITIFDTTLRDGEQSPGAAMTPQARLHIAAGLEAAGVDVIEAGFPAASPLLAQSVSDIAKRSRGVTIAALARCVERDIEIAAAAVRPAASPRIHVFIATSAIHLEKKLGMTEEQALENAVGAIRFARRFCEDVEFSAEDATRSDPAYLARIFSAAIAAGARTINIPDTVGYTTPGEYSALIAYLKEHVSGIERATISVHTHDDLGLATANALAGIDAGARQAEGTINGIGERAGNCALEEVIAALTVRGDRYGASSAFDLRAVAPLSRYVAEATAMPVAKNKAIVGANAFAHQSGIHQDGMLKDRRTYEILDPARLGITTELPLGRHSGRNALFSRARALGFTFEGEAASAFAARFRAFAEDRRIVTDDEIASIARATLEVSDVAVAV